MSQTGCLCDRLLPYSRHEQAQEKKLLESIEVAKGKYMPVRLVRDADKA